MSESCENCENCEINNYSINYYEDKNRKYEDLICNLNKEIMELNRKISRTYLQEEKLLNDFLQTGIDKDEYETFKVNYICTDNDKHNKMLRYVDYDMFRHTINTNIMYKLEIAGINIKKVDIRVKGLIVWSMDLIPSHKPELISIQPFKNGLLVLGNEINIHIHGLFVTEFRVFEKKIPNNILAEILNKNILVDTGVQMVFKNSKLVIPFPDLSTIDENEIIKLK